MGKSLEFNMRIWNPWFAQDRLVYTILYPHKLAYIHLKIPSGKLT